LVGDERWSYAGQLPYFRKTERHHDSKGSREEHGFDGPVCTSSASAARKFALSEMVREAYVGVGFEENRDPNSGSPLGLGGSVWNRREGQRLLTSTIYELEGVDVRTEVLVKRVVIEERRGIIVASAVETAQGEIFRASKEVIVCAGAYRTPQVLLLSGIGDKNELQRAGIEPVVELPEVGRNLHDHFRVSQW
jgi:choline dehydrogenase-like flavoprotein